MSDEQPWNASGPRAETPYSLALYVFLNGVVAAGATFFSANLVLAVLTGWTFNFWGFVVIFGFIGAMAVGLVASAVSLVVALLVLRRSRRRTARQRALLAAGGVFAGLSILAIVVLTIFEAWNLGVILLISFVLTAAYVFSATTQADRANSLPHSDRSIF